MSYQNSSPDWRPRRTSGRVLLERFNEVAVAEFERGTDETPMVARLSLATVEEAGRALAQDRAAYLVDLAKADALRTLGEPNAAADVMERHLG